MTFTYNITRVSRYAPRFKKVSEWLSVVAADCVAAGELVKREYPEWDVSCFWADWPQPKQDANKRITNITRQVRNK